MESDECHEPDDDGEDGEELALDFLPSLSQTPDNTMLRHAPEYMVEYFALTGILMPPDWQEWGGIPLGPSRWRDNLVRPGPGGTSAVQRMLWSGDYLPPPFWTREVMLARDDHGMTALHYAVIGGGLDALEPAWKTREFLLLADGYGRNLLHLAARSFTENGSILDLGLDPEDLLATDADGCTILHYAALPCAFDRLPHGMVDFTSLTTPLDKWGLDCLALSHLGGKWEDLPLEYRQMFHDRYLAGKDDECAALWPYWLAGLSLEEAEDREYDRLHPPEDEDEDEW